MSIAQGLYEGIELGNEGSEGLITYMRTDSVRIAPEAIRCRAQIHRRALRQRISPRSAPDTTPRKKAPKMPTKRSGLPISPIRREAIKNYLTTDQFKLYVLIWRRFLASQMNPAIYDTDLLRYRDQPKDDAPRHRLHD